MPTDNEYVIQIQSLGWDGLRSLWESIKIKETPEWALGKALEYLILRAFQVDGADVRWPYSVRIDGQEVEQIDGVVHSGGLSCLVESKDWEPAIPIGPIAKMRNQLLRRPSGAVGLVFSRSGFTEPALLLTRYISNQAILLWNSDDIAYALEEEKIARFLTLKYRACVETGAIDLSIRPDSGRLIEDAE